MKIRGMSPGTLLRAYTAGQRSVPQIDHVFLCVADHFEPDWNNAGTDRQRERVNRWVNEYPKFFSDCADSRGRPPQHTFFYPIECYDGDLIERLSNLVRTGYGDIEVHLHHEDDTSDSLRETLVRATKLFHDRHGMLHRDSTGLLRYGFIHGNWALDNSHPNGCHCGVNDEITVLRETGCYADFTMPAAPHPAQTRTINGIYYAIDDPDKPKSHDRGVAAMCDVPPPDQGLLMIQGPLVVRHRRLFSKPRLENGNVALGQGLSSLRIDAWLRAGVAVLGKPNWQFIKLHTHGAPESNADQWLNESATYFHHELKRIAANRGFQYYYVTAREMAMLVDQAERGLENPNFESLCLPVDRSARLPPPA